MTNREIFEWDTVTWSKALPLWENILESYQFDHNAKGLELGARNGGISGWLAERYDLNMHCSDYGFPTDQAKEWHRSKGLSKQITYHNVDATAIGFPDNSFDLVIFKSILGTIGRNDQMHLQQQAINEIHRILKPNGVLLFAENLKSSFFHIYTRKLFVSWARYWRYVTLSEMNQLLSNYNEHSIKSTGYFSAFSRGFRSLEVILGFMDYLLISVIPKNCRYVVYGYAIK